MRALAYGWAVRAVPGATAALVQATRVRLERGGAYVTGPGHLELALLPLHNPHLNLWPEGTD